MTMMTAEVEPESISEKTVELNLTVEVVNRLSFMFNYPAFAWGPTLRQEARWGFDAATGVSGRFIYLQFKRAYVDGAGHVFQLNRTAAKDQHKKLLALEAAGCAVRYALPRFTTLSFIASNRRRLLVPPRTAWIAPSQVPMPNGGIGHDDLHIHPGRRWLTSDPIDFDDFDDDPISQRILVALTPFSRDNSGYWADQFDKIFGDDPEGVRGGAIMFLRC